MTQLKEKGVVTRARLGVLVGELTSEKASELGVKTTRGAVVSQVLPDGPAARSGLQKDDVIVSLNGKEIDSRSLRVTVGSMAPGSTVNLKVLRGGAERAYSVTLDTMPADPQRVEQNQPFSTPRRGRRG
jgi:S1-C subfamily serine protease